MVMSVESHWVVHSTGVQQMEPIGYKARISQPQEPIKITIEVSTADQMDTILSTLINAEEDGTIEFAFNTSVS